ncbi:MAG: hypothetical protein KDC80_08470 [Saprospiraceae bacterium]|nr:hypothetical protein [Saprospiraceae bacterium]
MRSTLFYLLITVLWISGPHCTQTDIVDGPPVEIRVRNISDFNYDELVIWNIKLGPLKSNETTDYFTRETAYDKATISVQVDSFQFGQTVIDYVGEKPLKKGKYTFEVDLSDLSDFGQLSQNIVKDQ